MSPSLPTPFTQPSSGIDTPPDFDSVPASPERTAPRAGITAQSIGIPFLFLLTTPPDLFSGAVYLTSASRPRLSSIPPCTHANVSHSVTEQEGWGCVGGGKLGRAEESLFLEMRMFLRLCMCLLMIMMINGSRQLVNGREGAEWRDEGG